MLGLHLPFCTYLPLCCCNDHHDDEDEAAPANSGIFRWCRKRPNRDTAAALHMSMGSGKVGNGLTARSIEIQQAMRDSSSIEAFPRLSSIEEAQNELSEPKDVDQPVDENIRGEDNRSKIQKDHQGNDTMFSVMEQMVEVPKSDTQADRADTGQATQVESDSSSPVQAPDHVPNVTATSNEHGGVDGAASRRVSASTRKSLDSHSSAKVRGPESVLFKDQISLKSGSGEDLPAFSTFTVSRPVHAHTRDRKIGETASLASDVGVWKLGGYGVDSVCSDDDLQAWMSPPPRSPISDTSPMAQPPIHNEDGCPSWRKADAAFVDSPRSGIIKPALTEPMHYAHPIDPPAKQTLAICTWHAANGRAYIRRLKALDGIESAPPKSAWLEKMMGQLGLDGETDCLGLIAKGQSDDLLQRRQQRKSDPQ